MEEELKGLKNFQAVWDKKYCSKKNMLHDNQQNWTLYL